MKPPQQLYLKIANYCDYQERCTHEVLEKLKELEATHYSKELILAQLEKEGLLNDERFAIAFARGKFRFKKWGRIKIRYQLQQKQLPKAYITKALELIDDQDYVNTLSELLEKKILLEKLKNTLIDKAKLYRYAAGKGYEKDLIIETINQTLKKKY